MQEKTATPRILIAAKRAVVPLEREAESTLLREIAAALDGVFPPRWAESWDNVGLTVGRMDAAVNRILVGLDVTRDTTEEALDRQCDLLLTHHPFPWRERRRFDLSEQENALLARILARGPNLFAVHTNLDAAPNGHAAYLASSLGLSDLEPLKPSGGRLVKIAVFVPAQAAGQVRSAMSAAGGGTIGNYRGCSFSVRGVGRFTPGIGARPYTGALQSENAVREERIEIVCPEILQEQVLAAAQRAHPYEAMAYDVWPLAQGEAGIGLGRVGNLPSPVPISELVARCKAVIDVRTAAVAGSPAQEAARVAVCPGSAGDLVERALAAGAQALIGAEFSHHEALYAMAHGLALVEAGHFATEQPAVEILSRTCLDLFGSHGVEVIVAQREANPLAVV